MKEQIWGLLGNIYLAGESRQDSMTLVRDKSIKNVLNRMNQLSPHPQSKLAISFQHLFSEQHLQSLNALFKVISPQPLGQEIQGKNALSGLLTVNIRHSRCNFQPTAFNTRWRRAEHCVLNATYQNYVANKLQTAEESRSLLTNGSKKQKGPPKIVTKPYLLTKKRVSLNSKCAGHYSYWKTTSAALRAS